MGTDAQKPVVVTGAAGLLGFGVASRLAAEGRPVIGIDRVNPMLNPPFPFHRASVVEVHRLYALLSDGADGIIHCGGISGPMVSADDPYGIIHTNVMGTANMLEAARLLKLRRLVFLSSCRAYGHTPEGVDPVPESAALAATDTYGATKAACDRIVGAYAAQHGVDAVSLRIGTVYGPRRSTSCPIRQMIADGQAEIPTEFSVSGDNLWQFVHASDVVEALVLAYDAERFPLPAYNITGRSQITLSALSELVRDVVPGSRVRFGDGEDPERYLQATMGIAAVERDLSWKPRVALEEGIKTYAAWLTENAL
ncbi:MAG: NAD(P)-dependent oxidoreductase [Pseudomonadota bacterium]